MYFSRQIEFSFPTGLFICQKYTIKFQSLYFLISLTNFSDYFLSALTSYCYYYFLQFLPTIYLYLYLYYFIIILIFFIFIFIFVWGPKNKLQQMLPLYNTYGAGVCVVSFIKINKTELPNWSCRSLIDLKPCLYNNPFQPETKIKT